MRKFFILLILLIFASFFINPFKARANLLGSSFDGCTEPGDDPTGYILEKSGDPDLTREDIKRVLKYAPMGNDKAPYSTVPDFLKTKVSYGDMFEWLRTSENSIDCFLKGDYEKGLSIFGTHAGKFTASKVVGSAVTSIVGSGALIPIELFDWQFTKILNDFNIAAVNHQLILYITAIEKCEEFGFTAADCQQRIIDESKYTITATYPGVFFNTNGFIWQVEAPRNPKFISTKTIDGLNWYEGFLGRSLSSRIQLTPEQFYKGAAVIYDSMAAKREGKLKIVSSALVKKVTEEAHKLPKDTVAKATENSSIFQKIWSGISSIANKAAGVVTGTVKNLFNNNKTENLQPCLISEGLEKTIQKTEIFNKPNNDILPTGTPSPTGTPPPTATPSPSMLKQTPTLKPITTPQEKPVAARTINLRHETGCDQNMGGNLIPFVSLDWDANAENMISWSISRDNRVLVSLAPENGHSYFDGTIKAGETYNYIVKAEYGDGHNISSSVKVTVPISICGSPMQNDTPVPLISNPSPTLALTVAPIPIESPKEQPEPYFSIAANPLEIAKRLEYTNYTATFSEIEQLVSYIFRELTNKPLENSGLLKFIWYTGSELPNNLCGGLHSCALLEMPILYRSTETGYSPYSTLLHEIGHLYHHKLGAQSASMQIEEKRSLDEGMAIIFNVASNRLLAEKFNEPLYYTNFNNCEKSFALELLQRDWAMALEKEVHKRGEFWIWAIVLTDPQNPAYKIINSDAPFYLSSRQTFELFLYIETMPSDSLNKTREAIDENLLSKIKTIIEKRPLDVSRRNGKFGPGVCGDYNFLTTP